MTVRVNGAEMIRNVTVRLGSDGKILTMIGKNPDRTVGEFAQLLAGKPVIEVMDGSAVTAMYQGMKLMALTMEVIGGVLTITTSMQVDTLDMDTADELRQTIALQEAAIAEQDKQIAEQEKVIREMDKAVTEARNASDEAMRALEAIEEGIMNA